MGKNSLLFLALSGFLLISSGAYAATEANKRLASISGECLYQLDMDIVTEVLADNCKPAIAAYSQGNDEFYWIDGNADHPDDDRQISFREVGNYKDVYIYSVQQHNARVSNTLFIKRIKRPMFIHAQSDTKDVLQLVGKLGSGMGCNGMVIDQDWKGDRYMHVAHGYTLPDMLIEFLPKKEYESVEQDFRIINHNSACFANDEQVIDLEALTLENKGYYIFSEPSDDIKPFNDSSAVPCLKTQLATLKQEKLADVLLSADKAKATVQRIVRACNKNAP